MDLMKQKLAALRGEGKYNDGPSIWFKPDEGDQDIRIIPTNDGDPLKEFFFHYNVGDHKGGIMCPKRNFNERCPICAFASTLWREGVDKNDEESKKLAKSLFVRTRYFSPVVVRGNEDEGIKVYGYGKQAYELLLGYILDPEYGDIEGEFTGFPGIIGLVTQGIKRAKDYYAQKKIEKERDLQAEIDRHNQEAAVAARVAKGHSLSDIGKEMYTGPGQAFEAGNIGKDSFTGGQVKDDVGGVPGGK